MTKKEAVNQYLRIVEIRDCGNYSQNVAYSISTLNNHDLLALECYFNRKLLPKIKGEGLIVFGEQLYLEIYLRKQAALSVANTMRKRLKNEGV